MNTADILNFIGIVTAILGTWLFAYDVIWGYRNRNRIEILKMQLESEIKVHEYVKAKILLYPDPPYNEQDKEMENKKNDDCFLPSIQDMKTKIKELEDKIPMTAANYAAIGLFIMTLGGVLQIIAIFIPKDNM